MIALWVRSLDDTSASGRAALGPPRGIKVLLHLGPVIPGGGEEVLEDRDTGGEG
jgi:hypothetical protein